MDDALWIKRDDGGGIDVVLLLSLI